MTDIAKILIPNSEQEKTFYCKETKAPARPFLSPSTFLAFTRNARII